MSYTLVSIVLPLYQQADQIAEIIQTYQVALDKLPTPFEFVLLPNGPADGTAEACRREATSWGNVCTVASPPGWGEAVRTGIAAAAGDLVCFTNSARTSGEDLLLVLLYATAH